jgi:hypothetical protein
MGATSGARTRVAEIVVAGLLGDMGTHPGFPLHNA